MKAAVYMRVGNKDQLAPETDIEKNRQKLENLFDRKKTSDSWRIYHTEG